MSPVRASPGLLLYFTAPVPRRPRPAPPWPARGTPRWWWIRTVGRTAEWS